MSYAEMLVKALAEVLVFANVKGGVTKSTSTIATAIMLYLLGARVCVLDADPQGNTTDGLGYTPDLLEHTTYSLMTGKSTLQQTLKQTYFHRETGVFFDLTDQEELARLQTAVGEKRAIRGPDLVPCNISAAAAENELLGNPLWGDLLRNVVERMRPHYDFIVIDTNPGLSKLTVAAFLSASRLVIPSVPERWPTSGIRLLCGAIENAHRLNANLSVEGILFTRVRYADHKRQMDFVHREVLAEVNGTFPWMNLTCFDSYINESANFSKTASERSNIILALSADPISIMYWGFLAELLRKMQSAHFDNAVKMYQQQLAIYKEDQARIAARKQQKRSEGVGVGEEQR